MVLFWVLFPMLSDVSNQYFTGAPVQQLSGACVPHDIGWCTRKASLRVYYIYS